MPRNGKVMKLKEQIPVANRANPAFHQKKIWIDIDNSPHVPFFIPIIEELKERGYEVMLTARDLYQVCELLDFFHLECQVIGGSYGKNRLMKVLGNCYRACQLVPIAVKGKPLLSVSHGS